ncbi:hypothetical protein T459_14851 [Capsicum annuum]|uniref:RED-like N-terminal domain-containing protein n=1 Tax=Capsicum annuum TaxID=4072 RepID=A0A2G2ZIN0_CAPAN|nr:hypothetical protein T459_14851 [Capsicum annuum]
MPKYRDRAKERREDQNPDYELTELDAFHVVAPPGNVGTSMTLLFFAWSYGWSFYLVNMLFGINVEPADGLAPDGSIKYNLWSRLLQVFSAEWDRRDLVTCGCAAGVAAAFRDPKLGGMKGVYISMDLDCMEPAFAPGVSYIDPWGLSFHDVLNILHNLQADVVGADVVEFNPQRETVDDMTTMVAAKLVREFTAKISK